MKDNRTVLVGAFVLGGLLLFALGLFLIGNRRMLFEDHFELYAAFSNISGLQNGAIVRVAGMDAGEVTQIEVPGGPSGQFRVRLRVRADLRPLIRLDSIASIQNDGLVGNKFVQVQAGTDESPPVPEKGTIQSREPFDIADALLKLSDTIDLVTDIIKDVKVGVDEALLAVSTTAKDAQALMGDIGTDVRAIMASTNGIVDDVTALTAGVRAGRGTIGRLMNDDALYVSAKNIAAEAEKTVSTLKEAAEQAKGAVADFRGENGPMKGLAGDLQQTLTLARDAMQDLAENTEALKRNFFFRGFFNRRGYFDLEDVSVEAYRQGALETKDRRVLRIWADARVLFERDAEGRERLTDGGRARLDSAMATFVRYPRTSPFVVEGYARELTGDARFLLSRSRAQIVRDYLVGKFGLDPRYVATMPMGNEAPGSPAGDEWDGVALALFVPTSQTGTLNLTLRHLIELK
jgi:phospholipid/cholesterol/gamma-HCH transport system substrate-binding protein